MSQASTNYDNDDAKISQQAASDVTSRSGGFSDILQVQFDFSKLTKHIDVLKAGLKEERAKSISLHAKVR